MKLPLMLMLLKARMINGPSSVGPGLATHKTHHPSFCLLFAKVCVSGTYDKHQVSLLSSCYGLLCVL